MRINEVDRQLTQTELDQLEIFADRLFAKLGIDVEFTRHFLDRVNDERNVRQITASELTRLFKQIYKQHGRPIAQLGPDAEAVMKDLATDVNIPFALRWDNTNNELDLVAKTVMRKPDFKTSNKQFAVEYKSLNKDTIVEGLPALNQGGAMGTGLTPGEFKARYGMTPANASKTIGNVIELFPQEIKNNPRFKPFIKQYIMNPKQLGNLKAVNDNVINLDKWKKNKLNNKSWKNFFKKAPLRALGSFVTFLLTPSTMGDGEIPMDERIVMDTISQMTKADPLAIMEILKSSYPDTYEDMWYYKNAVEQYSDQIIASLDGKVDFSLQKEVDKVKKAKEMEKWNAMPLDPGLQKALDASQPKVDFTTGPELMGEPAPKIEPGPEKPDNDNEPVKEPTEKPNVIPFPPPADVPEVPELPEPKVEPGPEKPEVEPKAPEPKKPEVDPEAPEKPKVPPVPKEKPIEIPDIQPAPVRDPDKDPLPEPDYEPKDFPIEIPTPIEVPEPIKIEPEQDPIKQPAPDIQPKIVPAPNIQPAPDIQPAPKLDVLPEPIPKAPPELKVPAPRIPQQRYRRKDWDIGGYNDLYKTNLYRWTQKYGTFENSEMGRKLFGEDYAKMTHALITKMVKQGKTDDEIQRATGEHGKRIELIRKNTEKKRVKESVIMEGGAMPGVGAIHIDEINPTLGQLEKTLGLDLKNFTLGSVGKRQFSGDIDVALNLKPEELPAFIEKLKKNPLIKDIAKSSVIMTKVQIQNFDKSKSDGRPRTGFVQLDFMPGDPGWLKTYFHSPAEKESKYKGVFRNVMVATMASVHNRDDSDAETEDGRPLESRRLMWSPTDGLVRVLRTPVPRKDGNGYTAKNQNKIIDGPWKQADEIAKQLGLNSTKDLNSFESLLDAMKKNYTQEEQKKVIDGLKDSKVVQDIGIPDEIKDL